MKNIESIELEAPFAFRYRPDNEYTIDELKNSYIYFQNPKFLNDPFDCYPKLMTITKNIAELTNIYQTIEPHLNPAEKQNFKNQFDKNNFENFREFLEEFLEKYVYSFGIACLTMTPANHLMWSHYANFHKGICLQYDISEDKEVFSGIQPVKYIDEFDTKEYLPLSNENDFAHIMYTKSIVWKNEYELRVVKEGQGKVEVNKSCLKKVIFGIKTTDDYKNTVIETIKNIYPTVKFFNSEPLKESFGITLKQIIT